MTRGSATAHFRRRRVAGQQASPPPPRCRRPRPAAAPPSPPPTLVRRPHRDPKEPTLPALDVVIIGGCGHVGLPLGLAFADRGLRVRLHDIDPHPVDDVNPRPPPSPHPAPLQLLPALPAPRTLPPPTTPA